MRRSRTAEFVPTPGLMLVFGSEAHDLGQGGSPQARCRGDVMVAFDVLAPMCPSHDFCLHLIKNAWDSSCRCCWHLLQIHFY